MKSVDLIPFLRVVGVVLYFLIAAQGAFYHFGFAKALYQIPAEHFIELRKVVDSAVRSKFKFVYLSAVGILLLWILFSDKSQGFGSYGFLVLALLLLVTDMVLIIRLSEPVNELINSDLLNTEKSYAMARSEWLKFILIRGYFSLGGFGLLIVQLIWKPQ